MYRVTKTTYVLCTHTPPQRLQRPLIIAVHKSFSLKGLTILALCRSYRYTEQIHNGVSRPEVREMYYARHVLVYPLPSAFSCMRTQHTVTRGSHSLVQHVPLQCLSCSHHQTTSTLICWCYKNAVRIATGARGGGTAELTQSAHCSILVLLQVCLTTKRSLRHATSYYSSREGQAVNALLGGFVSHDVILKGREDPPHARASSGLSSATAPFPLFPLSNPSESITIHLPPVHFCRSVRRRGVADR